MARTLHHVYLDCCGKRKRLLGDSSDLNTTGGVQSLFDVSIDKD
jgi:hypothetical protein